MTRKEKERHDLGKTKRFRFATTKGMSRGDFTAPWNDNVLFGTLWVLRQYSKFKPQTCEDIGNYIGWRWRSVKNQLNTLNKSCLAKHIIKNKKYSGGKERAFFSLGPELINRFSFEDLLFMFLDTHYLNKYGPNNPETMLLELLREIAPKSWDYTGHNLSCNKIGKCYPDFTHVRKKHVIEHFGLYYHGEEFTDEPNDKHERDKINHYKRENVSALIVWEPEFKNMNKLRKKLKEFNDAI